MNRKFVLAASFVWLAATFLWWAFAFAPIPEQTPDWVNAARVACFGKMPNGLPEPYGWIGLIVSPLTLLIALLLIFDPRNVFKVFSDFIKVGFGRAVFIFIIFAFGVEGFWVAQKFQTAVQISNIVFDAAKPETDLPEHYPVLQKPLPQFSLIDQNGQVVTEKTNLGHPVLLTFAFAHCTTVCPVLVHQALQAVKKEDGVNILIITLDPWRDKPSVLKTIAEDWELPEYAHFLSSKKVENVTSLFSKFDIAWSRNEQNGDISHPALMFVINSQGKITYIFNNPHPSWLKQAIERVKKDDASRVRAASR